MKPTQESRVCLCGCAKTFTVAVGNTTNFFYSQGHIDWATTRQDEIGELARHLWLKGRENKATNTQRKRLREVYKTLYYPSTDPENEDASSDE